MVDRYNPIGEWRPLPTGGDETTARQRAVALTTDPELIGPISFVLYTGLSVLEFAVRGAFDLPQDETRFADGRLTLAKSPPVYPIQSTVVYDGTFELLGPDPSEVRAALTSIGQAANRLAFAYGASISWRPKYLDINSSSGYATPDESDIPRLERFLSPSLSPNDASLIDAAIDWHNRARGSRHAFNAYLGYYIPLEALAVAIGEGKADFGLGVGSETKAERKARVAACIQALYDQLYATQPAQFVDRAYFQCIKSIRHRLETAALRILGPSRTAELLQPAGDGYSLSTIRSLIAHGTLAVANPGHEAAVRGRLDQMADLSREFILRLLLSAPFGSSLPTWSGTYRAGLSFTDPRTLWVADPRFIAANDWRIRPEWCE